MDFTALQPQVVLGIVAHPDDLDFCAGGSMAAFATQGAAVYYLILTDGSSGTTDRSLLPQQLTATRCGEQRAAGTILGIQDVFFCAYPDGCLENSKDVRRDIVKIIRQVKPDVVVTWDPSMLYAAERQFINHPDHRASGQAALDAVFPLARDHMSFPDLLEQGYEPHKTPTVLLINFKEYNYCIDITHTFERKMQAIAAHTSQVSDLDVVTQRFTAIASDAGNECGVQFAETFIRIDIEA